MTSNFIYAIAGTLLVIFPILLAWLKGDQILDYFFNHKQQRQQQRRRKLTRALPVREEVLQAMLRAEDRRDQIDNEIAETLASFQQFAPTPTTPSKTGAIVEATERILLNRESHFHTYLDLAWLQSETIEVLSKEVDLLRQMAELDVDPPRPGQAARPPKPATEQLMNNLKNATEKRAAIDQKIQRIGADPQPGSRFDTTIT